MKYIILHSANIFFDITFASLEAQVNKKIDEGYKPYGNPIVVLNSSCCVAQAMIKED